MSSTTKHQAVRVARGATGIAAAVGAAAAILTGTARPASAEVTTLFDSTCPYVMEQLPAGHEQQ